MGGVLDTNINLRKNANQKIIKLKIKIHEIDIFLLL